MEAKVIIQLTVTVRDNGTVEVSGIPADPEIGVSLVADISRTMMAYYIKQMAEQVTAAGQLVSASLN